MKKTIALLLAAVISTAAFAQEKESRYAVTDFSVSYLRLQPDYESPLETQELMGTIVEVLDTDRYWVKVVTPQPYEAWCTNLGLVMMDEHELKEYINAFKCICVVPYTRIYSEPSVDSSPISDLVMGDVLRVVLTQKGKIVKSKKFVKVMMPSGKIGWVKDCELQGHDEWARLCDRSAASIVSLAKSFVGVPYLWGGMSPKGFDCSGLVRFCYMMNGVSLPRNASQQIHLGVDAPLDALVSGDLLFFGRVDPDGTEHVTHVGMYIGDNHFIHSSHLVRINSMNPSDEDCYEGISRLIRARRILNR